MALESKPTSDFDKYYFYQESVQSPENDVLFLRKAYKDANNGNDPVTLREDFCGTFAICCEWTQLDSSFQAIGVDLDDEPINYGKENYLSQLNDSQKSRVNIIKENVLSPEVPSADIVVAVNFSYYIFKERQKLIEYFRNCKKSLNENGIYVMDCFGGSQCMEANEEETEHEGFSYFWDQDSFDPVTNDAMFYIHFQKDGQPKKEQVFKYDWRMWSIPELKDCLAEAGFTDTKVYWEGTDEDGEGDGVFEIVENGEECEAWVAYLVSQ